MNNMFINPWNGWPKVTQCVIYLSHASNNLPIVSNAFLEKTAVNKYYIEVQNHQNLEPSTKSMVNLKYPWLQINKRGFDALKCPTIMGGKWMLNDNFALCNNNLDLVAKEPKMNIIL